MSKHRVLLADSSYTIRRIVELSFSEEQDIELITFESGTPLREKLDELKPDVVLVDIRLPEFNGYQVCKHINENHHQTMVFLLKGGFEPVNEELLKELNYRDIITKPFDSNALVTAVKEALEGQPAPADAPPVEEEIADTFPEDLPEISGFEDEAADGISFSDVKEEMTSDSDSVPEPPKKKGDTEDFVRDEVMPSEEITQGAQPEREDTLRPDSGEDMDNPFQEESRESDIDELLEREIERERQSRSEETSPKPTVDEGDFSFEPVAADEPAEETMPAPDVPDIPVAESPVSPEKESETATRDTLSEEELAQAFAEAPPPRQRDDIFAPPQAEEPPPIPEPEPPAAAMEQPPSLEIEATAQADAEEPAPSVTEDTEAERMLNSLGDFSIAEPPAPAEESPEPAVPAPPVEEDSVLKQPAPEVDPEMLVHRMEDKLSVAVREILWEVVPPLAEKIIKEEINRLEAQIDSEQT